MALSWKEAQVHILLCYGSDGWPGAWGPGWFLERALNQEHRVTYCGPNHWFVRAGFPRDLDLTEAWRTLPDRPDIALFMESGAVGFPRGWEQLEVPTVGYLLDVHINQHLRQMAGFFDYIFIAQRDYLDEFRRIHPRVYWLPYACDPDIHRDSGGERTLDIAFVGKPAIGNRERTLTRLARQYRMNNYRRFYTTAEMVRTYSEAKIVVNKPIKRDLNMRVFDALACGSMLITERIGNGQEVLFRDGEHLATYENENGLFELVEYYLRRDEERNAIAARGCDLVARDHTYLHRARDLMDVVIKDGMGLHAPVRRAKPGVILAQYLNIYSQLAMVDACYNVMNQLGAWRISRVRRLLYVVRANLARTGWPRRLQRLYRAVFVALRWVSDLRIRGTAGLRNRPASGQESSGR
ncbi:MAG: glycosyltransferase [Candidatus Rokubacteria bacterium]|nr:glycosyltransferase [Candidatus Rokubacteria bacterium]